MCFESCILKILELASLSSCSSSWLAAGRLEPIISSEALNEATSLQARYALTRDASSSRFEPVLLDFAHPYRPPKSYGSIGSRELVQSVGK
jgi:hypothetical protein